MNWTIGQKINGTSFLYIYQWYEQKDETLNCFQLRFMPGPYLGNIGWNVFKVTPFIFLQFQCCNSHLNLYLKLIIKKSTIIYQWKLIFRYNLEREGLHELSAELRRLFALGYRWSHGYTQCRLQAMLYAFKFE